MRLGIACRVACAVAGFALAGFSQEHLPTATVRRDTIAGLQPGPDTGRPPGRPELLSPPDGAIGTSLRPLFRWRPSAGAAAYVVEIAIDSLFTLPAVVDSAITDTTRRMIRGLLNSTAYYWRVSAHADSGFSTSSGISRFSTAPPPEPATGIVVFPPTRRATEATHILILRTLAADTLIVDSIRTRSGRFAIAPGAGPSPGPGDSLLLRARFLPDGFGFSADTAMVYTNGGPALIALFGASPAPALASRPSVLSLGPVALTDTATGYARLYNRGEINDLTVYNLYHFSGEFLTPPAEIIRIPPRDSLFLQVRFTLAGFRGKAYGVHRDTLVIDSDGGVGRIALRGESPPPVIFPAPRRLSFGSVGIADSAVQSIAITNPSINTLEIDTIFTRRAGFSPLIHRGFLRRGDTLQAPVRFLPLRFGPHADTLVIRSNASPAVLEVPLAGSCPYPVVSSNPAYVVFAGVTARTSMRTVVALGNSSLSALRIDSMRTRTRPFSVPRLPEFHLLRRGDSLHVPVMFSPDTAAAYVDTLFIFNSSPTSPFRVPLTGSGLPADESFARDSRLPLTFELGQNYPNPFNASTTVRFALPVRCFVRVTVFNSIGQELAVLAEGEIDAGYHEATWRSEAASGVYFCRLVATGAGDPEKRVVETRKMILIR